MAVLKCKMCGGDLNIIEGASTAECEFCGSVQTIPNLDDEKKLTLFARANRLRAACEFDKAAELLEQVIIDGEMEEDEAILNCVQNAKKAVADAYFRGGLACAKANEFEQAIPKLETAIEKSKIYNNTKAGQNAGKLLAQIYQKLGGEPFNTGDYAKAVEVFTKGYEANPRNTEMAMLLAESYFKMDKYAEGVKVCSEIAALPAGQKNDAAIAQAKAKITQYTNNKIAALQQANDFDGIIAMAETLEDKALAQKITIQAYLLKKDYDKVIELGEAAAEAQADEADKSSVYFQLGTAYNSKEKKEQAIAALKKVTAGPSVEAAKAALAELTK